MALSAEQTGKSSLIVRDGLEVVCEIRDLRLCNARFRQGGRPLIGEAVPLPLFWMQYAHHEDPERNAGSAGALRVKDSADTHLTFECTGATGSGSVESRYTVTLRCVDGRAYVYEIAAELNVQQGRTWLITPNPSHGEVEFCNFWAEGMFSSTPAHPIRYRGCYLLERAGVRRIRHHHLESADKHNVLLHAGARVAWLPEDENPCITLVSGAQVTAGICAYMWDAHLAYKVCNDGRPVTLPGGTTLTAAFRLSSIGKEEALDLSASAVDVPSPEPETTPAVVDGVHTFQVMCSDIGDEEAWPWETVLVSGEFPDVRFSVDRTQGVDDDRSLRIDGVAPVVARWQATTLGPAYRHPPFPDGARYRLEAFVRTVLTAGSAGIALRLHRDGSPGLFDVAGYEVFHSIQEISGASAWTRLVLLTPPISPAPDRLHILLELRGTGTCWFDNVHLRTEP